jgi:hypothetical protein
MIELFKEVSGRADLCTSSALSSQVVNAAYFLNQGAEFLSRNYPIRNVWGWHMEDLDATEYYLDIANVVAITEVWAGNYADGRWELEKLPPNKYRSDYGDLPSDTDQGKPDKYAIISNRLQPALSSLTASTYTSQFTDLIEDVDFSSPLSTVRLIIMPPADTTYSIAVKGMYLPGALTEDSDENYWSVTYPHALVQAAILHLEMAYRNEAGVNTAEKAINKLMFGPLSSDVHEEIADVDQMEG